MKISLLYELPVDAPLDPESERRTFEEALAQIELADEMGFHTAWAVEHHFLSGFSHSSAPEVFLGAASQRTKRIRLGHGVVVLPYNHPIRVAERIATLDVISGGRVSFGTGRSVTTQELGGFMLDPAESMDRWREAVRLIPELFGDEPVSYQGKFYGIGGRNVHPKPLQKPHPPMYRACTQPKSWVETGEDGLGALGFTLATPPEGLAHRIDDYRAALKTAEPVGKFVNDWVSVFTLGLCASSDEEARRLSETGVIDYTDHSFEYYTSFGRAMLAGEMSDVPESYRWYAEAAQHEEHFQSLRMRYEALREEAMILCGSPETIIEGISRYSAIGVDELMFISQLKGTPHDAIMESIRLMGEKVIPVVA